MELESVQLESGTEWDIEPYPWHGFGFLGKLIAVGLPLLSIGILVMPFLEHSSLRRLSRLPGLGGVVDWLVNGGGSWFVGIGLLMLWVGFLVFKRWRINSNEHQWVDAGCPQCQEREMVRVARERSDRWYGLLSIPAYRYACRNCTWRGLRIARRHRHVILDQEELIVASSLALEAAGIPVRESAQPEMRVEVEMPESIEAAAVLPDLDDDDATDEMPDENEGELASNEETDELMTEEPVGAPSSVRVDGEPPADDDLDWLWSRLSDDK